MKNLLEIAKSLRGKFDRAKAQLSDEEQDRINNEILNLSEADFSIFFDGLFDDCEDLSHCFYKRVSDLQFYTGFTPKPKSAITRLWIYAYQKPNDEEAKNIFLNEVLSDDTRYFWNFVSSLPGFCSKIELPPSFAAKWFHKLAEKVKNDLAGGGIYDSIESYTLAFPTSALEVFHIYENELLGETTIGLASLILGLLRHKDGVTTQKIDADLKSSDDVNKRVCYYNSLFTSYKHGTVTLKQLSISLDQMLSDHSKEVNGIAFWTVRRMLSTGGTDIGEFGIAWLEKNCSPTIPDSSKYHTISCMQHLCSNRRNKNSIDYQIANKIVGKILPVPNEHLGTLDELSQFLCDRAETPDEFTKTILCFVTYGIENLLCLFEHDRFEHFRNELSKIDLTYLITENIFSGDPEKCKLGFLFLGHSKFTPYTSKTLTKTTEENISLALKQLIRERNANQTIARKVQFLEPFFRKVSKELQEDFVNEIVIQAINYPQGCLEEVKRFGRSGLLKAVIRKAEKYFENLKKASNSPANSFDLPGYIEACFQANKRLNARVTKLTEEKSTILSVITKVQLIYGREFSFPVGQSMSDASPMAQFKKETELPRLELIDPEGMIIRRLQANR